MVHFAGVSIVKNQGVDENTKRKYQNCPYHEAPHLHKQIYIDKSF